jgi:carboxylesterase
MSVDIENFLNKGYYFKDKENKEIAILMLHGFAASPIELQPLAEYLKKDFDIYAPILPGHKTDIKDLDNQKYTNWLKFSEQVYNRLLEEYSKVILVGFSMGGTISLYLASKKAPYKIVTLSSPINFLDADFAKILLTDWKKTNISLSMVLDEIKAISKKQISVEKSNIDKMRLVINNIYKKIIKDFSVSNSELSSFVDTYDKISYNAIHEIFQLVKYVKTQVSKVESDLLIIHSKSDYLIPVSNSKEIMNLVSSNNVERFLLEESGHQVMIDKEHDVVFRKIEEFIKRKI